MSNRRRCANSTLCRDTGLAVSVFFLKVAACLEANANRTGAQKVNNAHCNIQFLSVFVSFDWNKVNFCVFPPARIAI